MDRLTARQQQVFDLIKDNLDETGYPPTRAEIAQKLGFRSANAAEDHLRALARKGVIEMITKRCPLVVSTLMPTTFCVCRARVWSM